MTQTQLATETIALTVNGERREVAAGTTLGQLLRTLELDPRLIVVERNRVILRDRDAYDGLALADGDTLELVHFVGGG
ncbi:MAG TPA: sulfur carrier protein ThiS [Gemmatimonadaceae bacterium]|nr:sulfur carrier protein ThiS [Gemmatimonadaceae bacterium]